MLLSGEEGFWGIAQPRAGWKNPFLLLPSSTEREGSSNSMPSAARGGIRRGFAAWEVFSKGLSKGFAALGADRPGGIMHTGREMAR